MGNNLRLLEDSDRSATLRGGKTQNFLEGFP